VRDLAVEEIMMKRLIARVERKAACFGTMMQRLGIDPSAAARIRRGAALAAASRTCLGCANGTECQEWLCDPAHRLSGAPPFCPNADLFAELHMHQA